MIVTCHCFFHPAKKLRSGAIVRFSDNSSYHLFLFYMFYSQGSKISRLPTRPVGQVVLTFHSSILQLDSLKVSYIAMLPSFAMS